MITKIYMTTDGRRFEAKAEAYRHQQRIALQELLREAFIREKAVNNCEIMDVEFKEKFTEWMLSEPTRTDILEILQMNNQDALQPNHNPERKSRRDDKRGSGAALGATQSDIIGNAVPDFRKTKE